MQSRFVRQLELDEKVAFMHFNFPPLLVKRDISFLGVIHRARLREGPPPLWHFFYLDPSLARRQRRCVPRHEFQMIEWPGGNNLEIMRRSALGMIRVYNLLPVESVECRDLKLFYRSLTNLVTARVLAGDDRWKVLLSGRPPLFQFHPLVY